MRTQRWDSVSRPYDDVLEAVFLLLCLKSVNFPDDEIRLLVSRDHLGCGIFSLCVHLKKGKESARACRIITAKNKGVLFISSFRVIQLLIKWNIYLIKYKYTHICIYLPRSNVKAGTLGSMKGSTTSTSPLVATVPRIQDMKILFFFFSLSYQVKHTKYHS